jgi:hypothetical protein
MNQQAIATIILRILGLSYFYSSIAAYLSSGTTMQLMAFNEAHGEERVSILAVVGSLVGIYWLFGLVLMVAAKPISRLLFRDNEAVTAAEGLSAATLIQAAVPLVGLYFVLNTLPNFVTTAVHWFGEKAGPPTGMPPQYGTAMANVTILMVISLFITLRSKTLSRFLIRSTN